MELVFLHNLLVFVVFIPNNGLGLIVLNLFLNFGSRWLADRLLNFFFLFNFFVQDLLGISGNNFGTQLSELESETFSL